jgi:hypothetical protein
MTPAYKGNGQPAADNGGWLSGIASWFGGGRPSYRGAGQASAGSSGYLSSATPGYAQPPSGIDPASQLAMPFGTLPRGIAILVPSNSPVPCAVIPTDET